jgi:hypothetical protein
LKIGITQILMAEIRATPVNLKKILRRKGGFTSLFAVRLWRARDPDGLSALPGSVGIEKKRPILLQVGLIKTWFGYTVLMF